MKLTSVVILLVLVLSGVFGDSDSIADFDTLASFIHNTRTYEANLFENAPSLPVWKEMSENVVEAGGTTPTSGRRCYSHFNNEHSEDYPAPSQTRPRPPHSDNNLHRVRNH
ncbi:unnamed protein product [Orchesella dallaii]|uniref:Uncharacterized protein n=1 Tax=Orchesella dallaii TaxID=48710 RepID=A0ABP1RVN1_9HEXA